MIGVEDGGCSCICWGKLWIRLLVQSMEREGFDGGTEVRIVPLVYTSPAPERCIQLLYIIISMQSPCPHPVRIQSITHQSYTHLIHSPIIPHPISLPIRCSSNIKLPTNPFKPRHRPSQALTIPQINNPIHPPLRLPLNLPRHPHLTGP